MDQDVLVAGGADGLNRIADAFRAKGVPVTGVYLVKLTSDDGYQEWVIRLIADAATGDAQRQMIYNLVELRREKTFPRTDFGVRFDLVDPNDLEASRIIDYARRLGPLPVTITNAMLKGLFIEYALVARIPQTSVVAA